MRKQRIKTPVAEPWMLPETHCLIASFPRSGNTWLSNMVADVLLQQQGYLTDTKLPVNEREIIPDLDRGDLETCRHADFAPRALAKTHLCYLNWMQKGVFLLRQPADTLVSYFHFHKRYPHRAGEAENGVAAFCKQYAEQWFAHTISFLWICEEQPEEFIPVTYESLLDSTEDTFARALRHLGIEASDSQIANSIAHHRFDNYSRHEDDRSANERFFRSGKKDSALGELNEKTFTQVNDLCWPLYERACALSEKNLASVQVA